MENIVATVNQFLSEWGVRAVDILVPVGILFFGWIFAILVSLTVRRLLRRSSRDERLAALVVGKERARDVDTGRYISRFVYWVIMLLVAAAFLARLRLAIAAEPINAFLSAVFAYVPRLLGAGILLLVAWIVARVARAAVTAALERTKVDDKLRESEGELAARPSEAMGEVAYWLVFLLFLPAVLGALELQGILAPVERMVDELLGFLPNLLSATVIFFAGWFAARILQRIVTSALAAAGLDKLGGRYGLDKAIGARKLSELLGLIVHVLIIVPVAVAALNALKLDAVTRPASQMLSDLLAAVPSIFGAGLVIAISFFVAKFVAGLVINILSGAGFDTILVKLNLATSEPKPDEMSPSKFIGALVITAIMLFAAIEAANLLGFGQLGDLISEFITLAGQILLGVAILALGLFLGDLAAKAVRGSEIRQSKLLATAARLAIVVLAGAMGLRQMGLANDIIALAFGLSLGAIAVAVALAFGLGARDEAAKAVTEWRARWSDGD